MDFIETKAGSFIYKDEPIRLRGFGIGSWLNLEHFMIGIPSAEHMIKRSIQEVYGDTIQRRFFDKFYEEFVQDDDFQFLKKMGVNFLRIPFNYRLFLDDNDENRFKYEAFKYIDRLMELATKYEIFIMLDLHTTRGGQNPDWHSDNGYGIPLFWEYEVFRNKMTMLWKKIANRYSEEPFLFGYDLLNEPAMAQWNALNKFYKKTIQAIREVDKNHIIVLEGDHFSMDFSGLEIEDWDQVAVSFHYYPTVWYTNILKETNTRSQRKDKIRDGLLRLLEAKEKIKCPFFCGEFGYGKDCGELKTILELTEDTIDLFEENQIDWLIWTYKDAHFMSIVSPSRKGKWIEFIERIANKWSQDIEKEQALSMLEALETHGFPKITEEEKYLLQFRLRAAIYLVQKNHIIRPELEKIKQEEFVLLAEDFGFKKCEIQKPLVKVIEKYTNLNNK
jgi:aryl-phospho-beta-D-glucosidase BglC (GH1 family)